VPGYVVAYVLLLAAAAVASWQVSERSGLSPGWLRNGDLLASSGAILLTVAYWNGGVQGALGVFAVPLLAAIVFWLVFALKPSVEIGLRMMTDASEQARRAMACASVALAFALFAPALFYGWRLALEALFP
jgi:hypothetical protein